eukprot:TRINITY_DN11176_c0_g1_i1.p1 TRINITY_DN11176_c0_g1~~TRINITY_DN11176_c0_g1_i1.p1  ORF type:complete len:275 (+),score=64.85 TRINITY_DN11176_c0_g1_i1:49-825(+)
MADKNKAQTKAAAPAKDVKKVVPVPESLKKAKKTKEQLVAAAVKRAAAVKKANRLQRREITKRAAQYEKQYKNMEKHLVTMRRMAKSTGSFYVAPETKVALVVRLRGINGVSPKVRKILRLLRLRQINNAVFVRLNKPMLQMLKLVEPYITYGSPNLKTVRELVYKRGYGKVNGQRIAISDNKVVADNLKQANVLSVEDVIHEIYTCGPNFKQVNSFLWPFKLNSPNGGLVKKNIHFAEGGDAGDREHFINNLVRRMN